MNVFARGGLAAVLLGIAHLATAPSVAAAELNLQNIEATGLAGDAVEIRLQLDGPAGDPLSFTIEEPARIAVDLQGTASGLAERSKTINLGALRSIATAEAGGRTRVVFNLDRMVPYDMRVDGDAVVVTLSPGAAAGQPTFTTQAGSARGQAPSRSSRSSAVSADKRVEGVDFRRGTEGEGRVIVELSDPATPVDVREEGNSVIVTFQDARVRDQLVRRLDVTDFATPVQTVDIARVGGDIEMRIRGEGRFEQLAYQSDRNFTVELKPWDAVSEQEKAQVQKEYDGERLTLNFQDIETRTVLQVLADFTGLNIVVSDTVTGNVTLRLQNVPWDQALDIILRTKGLDMRKNGNVILIAPAEEIAERERLALENQKAIEELEPLRSEFIQVNYAKAGDLADLLSSGEASLLSGRGNVSVDQRTNTLLIQETADRLEDIRRLVNTLDVPVRQVQIESRIVIANDDFSRDLGVRMGYTGVDRNGTDGLITVSGSGVGTDETVGSALDNLQSSGNVFPVTLPAYEDRLAVNVPVNSPTGRLSAAILGSDYLVDLELSALQAEGKGEIVSTPRVVTANQKEATIRQGVQIPYQEASSSGATATQFKDAVLSLTVTPQITPDDNIIMDLSINKDSIGAQVPSATGGFVPSIDTREVTTQVLVNNGETVVLGGVYEIETSETESKVPLFGDIPVLGYLFRSSRNVADKAELLIFVTPKIIEESVR